MVTIHFSPDILSVVILRFTAWNFTQMIEIKLDDFSDFFSESDAAQPSDGPMNQRFGVGSPSSAPPPAVPKPSPHQGLGMVVTKEYVIPDMFVCPSKFCSLLC